MARKGSYLVSATNTPVPQSQPYTPNQVKNEAGGYVYTIDAWQYLNRFIILGAEKGSYYVGEREFAKANLNNVNACIVENGERVVDAVIDVASRNASPKPDAALYTLALCLVNGDDKTRSYAGKVVSSVCDTGYKIQKFVSFVDSLGGWGRGKRNAIASWFTSKDVSRLAFQVAKYQSRDGWSMADILRLTHPKSESANLNQVFKWVVDGVVPSYDTDDAFLFKTIVGMEELKVSFENNNSNYREFERIIRKYDLPRECIPTELLAKKEIQLVLMEHMPFTALMRNLGNLSRIGAINENNMFDVSKKLISGVSRAKVHPIAILGALKVYQSGHGVKSNNSWPVYQTIVDALNDAFYESFKTLETTDKRLLVAIDVSGSMHGANANGMDNLSVNEAAGAMAMATLHSAKNSSVILFDFDYDAGSQWLTRNSNKQNAGLNGVYLPNISTRNRLDSVVKELNSYGGGGTDCTLPILYAAKKNIIVDTFVVYTDSVTWAGNTHNQQALEMYRKQFNPNARFVNVQMSSNNYSTVDPKDNKTLEVVGFDPNVPNIISLFSNGEI